MGIIDELTGPWDLVVVGHGFAGLSAARAALEDAAAEGHPLRVAVLERAAEADRGGSTAWTHAYLRLTGDGELDPSWQRNVRENADARANLDYIEAFGSNAHYEYPSGSSGLRSMTFGRLAGKAVVSDAAVAQTV